MRIVTCIFEPLLKLHHKETKTKKEKLKQFEMGSKRTGNPCCSRGIFQSLKLFTLG